MRFAVISNQLCLVAAPGELEFKLESFYELEPGQMVTSIGDGRNTGSYWTDRFKGPIEYMGAINDPDEDSESGKLMYAFRVPEDLTEGDTKGDYIYLLYEDTGSEIFRGTLTVNDNFYCRVMKPEFEIVPS